MNHLEKIAARLEEYGLDAMLITSEPGEFYALGLRGEGYLLVSTKGNFYSTDSRYIELVEKSVENCQIHMISGDTHVQWAAKKCAELGVKTLGFEEDYLSVGGFEAIKKAFSEDITFVPANALIANLRASKDEGELAVMRKAQEITDRAFSAILKDLRPGVKECEIAAKLTYYMMSFGASKNSFDPIVASGANGSMPHAVPSEKAIQEGEFITMDFGCIYGGYCSDMTRTVALGQPTEEMREVYNTVLEAQLAGIAMAKAGVIGAAVHEKSQEILAAHGYGDKMGHGFGHSLGIEIHEDPGFRPASKGPMPVGAVVSAEPGIYLPGKFGVRIEDVVVLREDGCEVLTKSPKELIIL